MTKRTRPRQKGNGPAKKFSVGRVNATIWRNEGAKGLYYTVNFDRRYRTDEGEWKSIASFSPEDLPDLAEAAQMAQAAIPLLKRIAAGEGE